MEIGICLKTSQCEEVADLPIDYAEFPFAEIAQLSSENFAAFKKQIDNMGIACPVMTQLLPKTGSIVEIDDSFETFRDYLARGYEKAAACGTGIVILGNAGARNIREEAMRPAALSRLITFCIRAAELAAEYDIVLCLEPLNRIQSNMINTIEQAAAVASTVDRRNFGIVWDYFHFQVEKDKIESVYRNSDLIKHCHTAALLRRGIPDVGEQRELVRTLRTIRYHGRISFEFDRLIENRESLGQAIRAYREVLERE